MKKQSKLSILLSLLMMLVSPMMFVSCGSDDDRRGDEPEVPEVPDMPDLPLDSDINAGDERLMGLWSCTEYKDEHPFSKIGLVFSYYGLGSINFMSFNNNADDKEDFLISYDFSWHSNGKTLYLDGYNKGTNELYKNTVNYEIKNNRLYIISDSRGELQGRVFDFVTL